MNSNLLRSDLARHGKSGNKSINKKIEKLLDELRSYPESGTGKPERLKHDFTGYWSRRINLEHRLIYFIEDQKVIVTVISAYGHYDG